MRTLFIVLALLAAVIVTAVVTAAVTAVAVRHPVPEWIASRLAGRASADTSRAASPSPLPPPRRGALLPATRIVEVAEDGSPSAPPPHEPAAVTEPSTPPAPPWAMERAVAEPRPGELVPLGPATTAMDGTAHGPAVPSPPGAPPPADPLMTAEANRLGSIDYLGLVEDLQRVSDALDRFNKKLLQTISRSDGAAAAGAGTRGERP